MKYQVQFLNHGEWVRSSSNPGDASGWSSRAEAALEIAMRLRRPDCNMDFRIREVVEPTAAGENKIDSRIQESEQAVDRVELGGGYKL